MGRIMENDWVAHTLYWDVITILAIMFIYVMAHVTIEFLEIKDRKKKK